MQYNLLPVITVLNFVSLIGTLGVILSRKAKGKKVFSKPFTAKSTVLAVIFGVAWMIIVMLIESEGAKFPTVWSSPSEWALSICCGIMTTVNFILYDRL